MTKHIRVTEEQYKVLDKLKEETKKEWNYHPRKEPSFSESLDLVLKEAITNGKLGQRMAKYDELSQYVPDIEKSLTEEEKEKLKELERKKESGEIQMVKPEDQDEPTEIKQLKTLREKQNKD